MDYANLERNLEVFDKLVVMFRNREEIPSADEFPGVIPYLDSYAFPGYILTADRLEHAFDNVRLKLIRQSIIETNKSSSVIHYKVPWYDTDIIEKDSIDMIFPKLFSSMLISSRLPIDKCTYGLNQAVSCRIP